jgi:RNA polymerase sigma-70 factor (ECF subfamily)
MRYLNVASPVEDHELIRGCLREDRKYQEAFFHRYAGKLMAVSMRYARHRMEAEDILQDAFIRIFDHIGQFQGKGSLEGWMRRIVVNTALKNIDRKSFSNEIIGMDNTPEDISGALPTVFSQLHEEELLHLIQQLPDGYRIVFNMYAIEGYSHAEISELLGIQESTSRSQLVKARKMLQTQILEIQKVAV